MHGEKKEEQTQAERKHLSDDGFLLHSTVVRGLKEHVRILLDAG